MQRDLTADAPGVPAAPTSDPIRPPRSEVGLIGWLRKNLFSSLTNTVLTLVALWLIYELVAAVVAWAFVNAIWEGEDGTACTREHADLGAGRPHCRRIRSSTLGEIALHGRHLSTSAMRALNQFMKKDVSRLRLR